MTSMITYGPWRSESEMVSMYGPDWQKRLFECRMNIVSGGPGGTFRTVTGSPFGALKSNPWIA